MIFPIFLTINNGNTVDAPVHRRIVHSTLTAVKRRSTTVGPADALSRKRTADMLRKLRTLKGQVKMLKARIDREMRPKRTTD